MSLLEVFENRDTLGINFDPSHLIWQGLNPAMFLEDFIDKVYHVHVKDTHVNLNGRNGILGSHITFGAPTRGWNFVFPGHGDVDFDKIIRVLNYYGYEGPSPSSGRIPAWSVSSALPRPASSPRS